MAADASIEQQLAATQLLSDVPAEALTELAGRVTPRAIPSGQVLCREGEAGDSAFLVVAGRFRADAGGRMVGEVGRGELVGEIAMLTGEARTATVTAIRDSRVLELDADVFDEVLSHHAECYRAVSRQLVERLQRVLTTSEGAGRATILTVLHDGRPTSLASIDALVARLGPGAAVVGPGDVEVDLVTLESSREVVVLTPDPGDAGGRRWSFGQCDRALVFVDAETRPHDVGHLATDGRFELVLVHPPSVPCPVGTRRWLEVANPIGHHHIRRGVVADLDRLIRRFGRRETVLVLSGGGARGLAHAGVWRALEEHEVPIDAVVGVSAGAVAAAVIALGHGPDEGGRLATRLFVEGGSPIDFTIPTVALAAGTKINERLKELCGEDRSIEDLWLPYAAVSANLTTTDLHVHQRGSLWRALRASTAIPGVFPPVAEPEGLLVDGGLVSNLPVDLARRLHPGATVIASDVGRKLELAPDGFPVEAEVSGWTAVRSRLGRDRKVPGMVRILAQVTALGGAGSTPARGDLHLELELDQFGIFDFRKASAIIDAGYRQSLDATAAFVRQRAAAGAVIDPSGTDGVADGADRAVMS